MADAVLVEITPDSEAGEVGVLCIDDAVVVAVEIGQGIEAVGRQRTVGFDGGVAKQFAPVIYRAVAVPVPDHKAVIGTDPAGGGLDAVCVLVEQNGRCGVDADGLDTVVVEVEDKRVAADWRANKSLGVAVFAVGQGVEAGTRTVA